MFASARGVIFNSHPEQALAERLYGLAQTKKIVLGMGLDSCVCADADAFRKKFRQVQPFLLYVGRKDRTKNTDLLLEYFSQYKQDRRDSRLQLVLVGKGNLDDCGLRIADCGLTDSGLIKPDPFRHHEKSNRLRSKSAVRNPQSAIASDLGFLEAQDKYNAYAAATVLCNPSTNESFSIVLMESWLCGTPVLVNSCCDVTRDFVERSRGGLHFSDFYEFEACTDYLIERPDLRKKMAAAGAKFVGRNYSWDALITRLTGWLENTFE
jgi:glycosyltransferase involved in cell wall biosynthesis